MRQTILLVDDEPDIRDVLSLSLHDMGYDVYEAENGDEALRIFKDKQPSMVMTDIKMPGMDGIELLKKIKHENPETEVIMITGHGDMDLAIRSLKCEATDFITKPINVDALELALQRVRERIFTRQKLQEYTENLEILLHEKTELQSHLASLGLMIGSISHGIKGLLTALDGGIYLLDSGIAKENEVRIKEGWDTVKLTVERIRKMVMDILFYAKERDLRLERIDVRNFVEEIAKEIEPKFKSQKVKFVDDFEANLGEFEVDVIYLHSALLNIIENGIDACLEDKIKKSHQIIFAARRHEDRIILEITDNGSGMDSETQDKIFTPFFSSKGNRGTGLGLFIANTIVEQHGGEIKVASKVGQGTRFKIMIPRKPLFKGEEEP
jgi:signal transduction histidine kinase